MARADKRQLEREAIAKGMEQIRKQEQSPLRQRIWGSEEVAITHKETTPTEEIQTSEVIDRSKPEVASLLSPATSPAGPQTEIPKIRVTHPVFEMVRDAVRRDGFTHPEQGQFIMLPREFEAILALENKAVVQVVFLILRETIGWIDEDGRFRRREWVQLGQKHFEVTCGSKSQGFYGVKTAIQKGYILRRPYKNTFEYAIRWKENEEEAS